MNRLSLLVVFFVQTLQLTAQGYKDSTLSIGKRVLDLMSYMSPEEKFRQLFMISGDPGGDSSLYTAGLFGIQLSTMASSTVASNQLLDYSDSGSAALHASRINQVQASYLNSSRLGIPVIPFDEALHGLVRDDATVFPQSIGLAATWNPLLMSEVAAAIASECRSRGIRQVLSPVVNIASDVRWGRTEETYGEDPFLVTEMGLAFVTAFESRGVIATPKHFVANAGDGGRDSYPIHLNERLMREIHLPPFEACIRRGGARSIMTAYNSYDGSPCTSNSWLLRDLLKNEWGFQGFVISDAGGTGGANVLHMTAKDYSVSSRQAIEGGLDVIFQTSFFHDSLFIPPFLDGSINLALIDTAVFRVLKAKFELGLFDSPYASPEEADLLNHCPAHVELAREAARQSIVLLRNRSGVLPVHEQFRTIALIGEDAVEARLGGYSGPGESRVSIFDGIKQQLPSTSSLTYSKGCDRNPSKVKNVPSSALSSVVEGKIQSGLLGDYYVNISLTGEPAFSRIDKEIDFRWTLFSPDPEKLGSGYYSVRWTGNITAPESGLFKIGIDGNDGYRLYIDDKLLIDNSLQRTRSLSLVDFEFRKGMTYRIRIEYAEPRGNAWFRLVWTIGVEDEESRIREAVRLAARSDLAILVMGIEEGEFLDRSSLSLPGRQEELILRVAATGTPVVVVLVGGSAITMNSWLEKVDAVILVWYPGEQGGHALADVLFGRYNPAGRLPISFPQSVGQLPLVYNHKPTGRGDDYINASGQPLFPFGFGMSYSTFEYGEINLIHNQMKPGDTCQLSLKVTNTGKCAGDEVVQLYIHDELATVARPVLELKGFQRIHLNPGESKFVNFMVTSEMLMMLDKELVWVLEPGEFRLMVGSSSRDIRQQTILRVSD
jgi:beta-glucosidase